MTQALLNLPARVRRGDIFEIRALVARDAVCTYGLIDSAYETGCDRRDEDKTPWFFVPSSARWCERERMIYKDYWGSMNATVDALPDLHAVADALELPDVEELPLSVPLRASHPLLAEPVRDALDVVARYEALAGGSPPGRE